MGKLAFSESSSKPNTWTATSTPSQWCQLLKLPGALQPTFFYVYVSDAGFPESGQPKDLVEGHFDYREWVITCP